MTNKLVAITGARGFIGAEVLIEFGQSVKIIQLSRSAAHDDPYTKTADYQCIDQLTALLKGVDTVVHLAGPAHTTKYQHDQAYYEREIHENTLNLFEAAMHSGVRHFIYASSIKVYGEETMPNSILNELSPPIPKSCYGIAKWNAEQSLRAKAHGAAINLSIIRFPPVYGAGSKGSIRWFTKLSRYAIPLPISNIPSIRSLLFVGNAAKIIVSLTNGSLEPGLYCPSDYPLKTVGDFYKHCWRIISPFPKLIDYVPNFPLFFYSTLKSIGIMRPLFSSFAVQSKYEAKFKSIGFLTCDEALAKLRPYDPVRILKT